MKRTVWSNKGYIEELVRRVTVKVFFTAYLVVHGSFCLRHKTYSCQNKAFGGLMRFLMW